MTIYHQVMAWFKNSVSDLFDETMADEQIDRIFAGMASCPQHTFQVLTKRPERLLEYMSTAKRVHDSDGRPASLCRVDLVEKACQEMSGDPSFEIQRWPLPNVWPGTTVESQATANERVSALVEAPAAHRFLICDPSDPIDLRSIKVNGGVIKVDGVWEIKADKLDSLSGQAFERTQLVASIGRIDQVIVRAQNGRHCDIKWIESIARQCKATNVPVFIRDARKKAY